MQNKRENSLFGAVDYKLVLIYVALVLIGWVSIYSAVYNEAHPSIFDLSQRYGMQLVWMGMSFALAIIILLLDSKFYHIYAYPLYWIMIVVLIGVMFVGKEVNGSRSWIMIGSQGIQPAEMAKFVTSLALARLMSRYNFSLGKSRDLIRAGGMLALPMLIIILQNDTGSALVYAAFLFMFYREGLYSWIYWLLTFSIALFIGSFLLNELSLLILMLAVCLLGEVLRSRRWRSRLSYVGLVGLLSMVVYFGANFIKRDGLDFYQSLLLTVGLTLPFIVVYALRNRIRSLLTFVALFVGMVCYSQTVDFVFDDVLQTHQQKRILDLLGVESDLNNWGYNVHQSKITIGSGGLFGKGFLGGTQTKYDFVPEQGTDFIFCTIGEEWGFVGSVVVVALFAMLILRLMKMGERQREPFRRIYCYCVASIFLAHVVINIGMTIGIMPVVGIPLPFFSYGGSSMLTFTLMLFVAIKLDSAKKESLAI